MSWIEHVKSVAKKEGITYKQALSVAGASYTKKTPAKVVKADKTDKAETVKVECPECGAMVSKAGMSRHKKTSKHLKAVDMVTE